MTRSLSLAAVAAASALLAIGSGALPAHRAAAHPPAGREGDPALLLLQQIDARLLTVGYRLATSAGALCAQVPLAGFTVHELGQYPANEQQAARDTFGFDDSGAPRVLAVAPGSPAERAGLRANDALLALDGTALPAPAQGTGGSYARVAAIMARIEAAAANGTMALAFAREGERFAYEIRLDTGCASRFETRDSATLNSQADGRYVIVTTGIVRFVESDDELAAVMAHELAHNILRHRARLDAAGIRRGLLQEFGRNARLTRRTEDEADRLGVYLVDRAGYSMAAIGAFWERFRREHGAGIFRSATHSSERARIASIEGEIARIAALKAAGKPIRPEFMEAGALPALD